MVNIEKLAEDTAECCTSCHCTVDQKDIYKVEVGKTEQQTMSIKLCYDCMLLLGNEAYEIYRKEEPLLE